MSFVKMLMVPGTRANREHNLFVSQSKHLYVDAKGYVRYQKKALDPRTAGGRRILTRLLILDVDTGAMYGELHDDDTAGQLSEFLVRAWHPKAGHYFRGVPETLNVPAKVVEQPKLREELRSVIEAAGITSIGRLPGGFAAGVHALRTFEDSAISMLHYGSRQVRLGTMQAMSALASYVAAQSAFMAPETWDQVTALPIAARNAVEERFGATYWHDGPFAYAFPPELAGARDLGKFSTRELMAMRPQRS